MFGVMLAKMRGVALGNSTTEGVKKEKEKDTLNTTTATNIRSKTEAADAAVGGRIVEAIRRSLKLRCNEY